MFYFIGIDIGTTHTKAVVVTETGRVLHEARQGYPSYQPLPGYHQQDPEELFTAVSAVLQKAVQSVADKDNIVSIIFSAAMHSVMAVDKNGKPLTALFTWADTRSSEIAKQLLNDPRATSIYQQTGVPAHPMSPLCKITWIREQESTVFADTHKFISGKEYIWYQLTGEFAVDHSIASATGLFDIHRRKWNEAALDFAGISANKLSQPVSVSYVASSLNGEYAIPGISSQTKLLIGGSDGLLANIGSGAVLPAEMALTIGTSGAVRVLKNKAGIFKEQVLFQYAGDQDHYLLGGAINNGGIALKWFQDNFLEKENTAHTGLRGWMEKAILIPAGSEGLIFLPYLYGERAPVWDASAKGVFMGVQAKHTRAHFLRAVLEGIAFSLLQIVEAMEATGEQIDTVYASGGFIESPLWLRIMTDVLQKKMNVSHSADASSMGAVFLGFMVAGKIKEWKDVKAFIRVDEELNPDTTLKEVYGQNYKVYAALYGRLKDLFV